MTPGQDVGLAIDAASQVLSVARAGQALDSHGLDQQRAVAFRSARDAFQLALRETVVYMQRVGTNHAAYSEEGEQRLSLLWTEASNAIAEFDPNLAERCYIKGQGWLDPAVWDNPRFKDYKVGIDDMRQAGAELIKSGHPARQIPSWFPIAGVGFAVATFLSLFYLLVGPGLPAGRRIVFDVWVAFCVAASAAFLGGTAIANGQLRLPLLKEAPVRFSAAGGVAIFIVVLLLMVAVNG
jgi:hypothetical protein